MNKYFLLFANCIPVKGAKRSVICDLQRSKVKFIPNDLYEILTLHSKKSMKDILDIYDPENKETIRSYFHFLIKNNFGLFVNKIDLKHFPSLDLNYMSPFQITNTIIDHSSINMSNYSSIFKQLDELGAIDLQLRFFEKISLEDLDEILSLTDKTRIKSIQLILMFNSNSPARKCINLLRKHLRIVSVVIHSSPLNMFKSTISNVPLNFIKEKIKDESHCGIITSNSFELNITSFAEAVNYNSCLNKKVSIDKNGNIKNCPSMKSSHGNVREVKLKNAIQKLNFKKFNTIKKDQIEICQDCEFRYICTDCRAYTENPDNLYSKPLKCGYNPYTNKWSDWSRNPLKQEAINIYNLTYMTK